MRALITARHLVRATRLRENAHVDVLDVSARHADRDDIFRLTRSRTGVTTDAAGVVDDLGPLHSLFANCLLCSLMALEMKPRIYHGSGEYWRRLLKPLNRSKV